MSASITARSGTARSGPAVTRPSLLFRVRDAADHDAWDRFARLYGPLIYRFGRRQGLQDADAADLVQDVLLSAALAMVRFEYDPQRGRFRSWLFTVARNALSRMLTRRAGRPDTSGGRRSTLTAASACEKSNELEQSWDRDYRRQLFEWAVQQVQPQVEPNTWKAFQLTAVQNVEPAAVAGRLGMSVGAVYIARSRVTDRIRQVIRQVEED